MYQGKPIPTDLLILYDEYSELDAYLAFFCDATAALSANREEWLDNASTEGLCLFSQWLKNRSRSLKDELETVWKWSNTGQRPN